ncbi:hypothetical protein CFN78_25355 [Amycolatopsis antarctica]|uniref:Phosphatidic acid phosphatase type 2/haloperoxidase domain-containing protein n=1 Tax=Amycolatopsis antarctica TaxID=1854586 RepID=A0A263CX07_9PSEU|nr:phosphatase PAP2 family protein [Amycolatopsis antarctica]OZM70488.1 hypothetical protein CFN78_25355 [Amycolatopsis antarctica]
MGDENVEDVPDISARWYREVVDFAAAGPDWLRDFAALFTDAAPALLAFLLLLCWWRARGLPARVMAVTLLGACGVAAAYLISEAVKLVLQVERPCRTLTQVVTAADCPPPGDWSFPSNHSVVAGAAMAAILFASGPLGMWALPIAFAGAASRVFVGAHYPHDVIAGLSLGAVVVSLLVACLGNPAARLVERLRHNDRAGTFVLGPPNRERPAGQAPPDDLPTERLPVPHGPRPPRR